MNKVFAEQEWRDPNSIPSTHINAVCGDIYNHSAERWRQVGSWAHSTASLANLVNSISKISWRVIEEDIRHWPLVYARAHTHAHTLTHRHTHTNRRLLQRKHTPFSFSFSS